MQFPSGGKLYDRLLSGYRLAQTALYGDPCKGSGVPEQYDCLIGGSRTIHFRLRVQFPSGEHHGHEGAVCLVAHTFRLGYVLANTKEVRSVVWFVARAYLARSGMPLCLLCSDINGTF